MAYRLHDNHALRMMQAECDEMKTPEDVAAMMKLHELGWGKKRIARELGISKATVARYIRQGGYKPYRQPARRGALDKHKDWLRECFLKHKGNAEVVRQDLITEHEIHVSLRTVERAVQPYREELERAANATVRFETPPGRQMQIDFGSKQVEIGGHMVKAFLFVATLGFSRRMFVKPFRNEGQGSWLQGMDEAFRHFNGVPEEVLMDNARALVQEHNIETREVRFNERLLSFAAYWGFKPRACAPYRARTKGKDERGVGYVKRNAIAGRTFATWEELESHLHTWSLTIADQRIHGTTGQKPYERFTEAERVALSPLNGKPPFYLGREHIRKVHTDAHIEYETNRYSVPWVHIGKQVQVRVRQEEVSISLNGTEIARHGRVTDSRKMITLRDHLSGIVGFKNKVVGNKAPLQESTTAAPKMGELQRDLKEYQAICGG